MMSSIHILERTQQKGSTDTVHESIPRSGARVKMDDCLLVKMRFHSRHIGRVGHSGCPHVLFVSLCFSVSFAIPLKERWGTGKCMCSPTIAFNKARDGRRRSCNVNLDLNLGIERSINILWCSKNVSSLFSSADVSHSAVDSPKDKAKRLTRHSEQFQINHHSRERGNTTSQPLQHPRCFS